MTKLTLTIEPLCNSCATGLLIMLPQTFPMGEVTSDRSKAPEVKCARCGKPKGSEENPHGH